MGPGWSLHAASFNACSKVRTGCAGGLANGDGQGGNSTGTAGEGRSGGALGARSSKRSTGARFGTMLAICGGDGRAGKLIGQGNAAAGAFEKRGDRS
jgi:hypothetical protein